MSVVAALYDEQSHVIVIGSDTLAVVNDMATQAPPKWIVHEEAQAAVGVAGSTRIFNLIEPEIERLLPNGDHEKFPNMLEELLLKHGHDLNSGATRRGDIPICGAELLIANRVGLWHVYHDFSITRVSPYWAIGSGELPALGAMHALYNAGEMDSRVVVRKGIEAAIHLSVSCGGDVWSRQLLF